MTDLVTAPIPQLHDEIIISVYYGNPLNDHDEDMFLDCYFDMGLHLTKGYRMILETERYYLFLQHDGVFAEEKKGPVNSVLRDNEYIEPSIDTINVNDGEKLTFVDYESTLFTGQRLLQVKQIKLGFEIEFDDFSLWLYPHMSADTIPRLGEYYNCIVYGTKHLISRKCSCGGTGVLMLDEHSDYEVECDRCHISTYACQNACDAIEAWNEQRSLFAAPVNPEESFWEHCREPIRFIAVPKDAWLLDVDLADCSEFIVAFTDRTFLISERYAGLSNQNDPTSFKHAFSFKEISGFNPQLYPHRIVATDEEPIRFIRMEDDEDEECPALLFKHGMLPILVTADYGTLVIGLSSVDENDKELHFNENVSLFQDE